MAIAVAVLFLGPREGVTGVVLVSLTTGVLYGLEVQGVRPAAGQGQPAASALVAGLLQQWILGGLLLWVTRSQANRSPDPQPRGIDVLMRMSRSMNRVMTADDLLDAVVDHFESLIPFDACDLLLANGGYAVAVQSINRRGGTTVRERWEGRKPFLIEETQDLHQMAVTRHPVVVEDTKTYPGWIVQEERSWVRSALGIALYNEEELQGFLIAVAEQPGRFDVQADREPLEIFSNLAGVAITKARLLQDQERQAAELEQRFEHLTVLAKMAQEISASLDVDEILTITQRRFAEAVRSDFEVVFYNHRRSKGSAREAGEHQGVDYELAKQLHDRVREKGRSIYLPDVAKEPGFSEGGASPALRAFAALPLRAHGEVLAVVVLGFNERRDFLPHVEFLETLASAAAIGLSRALQVEQLDRLRGSLEARVVERTGELQKRIKDVEALNDTIISLLEEAKTTNLKLETARRQLEMSNARSSGLAKLELAINLPHELTGVLDQIVELITDLLPADFGSVILWNADQETYHISASNVPDQEAQTGARRARKRRGATRWIIDHREPLAVPDTAKDPFGANWMLGEYKLRAYLGMPILEEDRVLGVLYALDRQPRTYSEDDVAFLRALAQRAAVVISKVRMTERLQAALDRAESADRVKSAFLAAMSHELRTPLNSIIGFTSLLLQDLVGPLNDEQRKQLGMVQSSANHLLALINDVLDISKIEAGEMKLAREIFELPALIEHSLGKIAPLALQKKIAVTKRIDPGLAMVQSDRRRVEQVLINLLSNAVKFTPEGGRIHLQVARSRNGSEGEDEIHITVRDTGIGIRDEDQRTLFEPFQQVHQGTSREYGGTGLGLSISKKLVEMLGGEIWVKSELGKGAEFGFSLPWKEIP